MPKTTVLLMLMLSYMTLEQIYGETVTLDISHYNDLRANMTLMKAKLNDVQSKSK